MKEKLRPIINLIITITSIVGIYLINSGLTPLKSAIAISQKSPFVNYALPPGYVFSIWGLIYLGFLSFSIFELIPASRVQSKFANARPLIILSIFLNLLWVTLVGFDLFIIPFLLQWVMLGISIAILFLLRRNVYPLRSRVERSLVAAFSLYAGWLTVAMIPFTAEVLMVSGWNGGELSPQLWACIMFVIAALIVWITYKSLGFIWYLVPIIWAFFGIALKFNGIVSITATTLAALGLIYFAIEYFRKERTNVSS